ncbi:hypothetical protein DYB32_008929 [Aphanomyces invadans]|uniref:Uncharacterized protein n=1 Tax=Aphanomyces invadans TaxID=157072 RepID=A0A3R6V4X1_9STRA|nr:hypothetical protein DYB32_008929 [Aphanomyces invadans]
MTKEDRRLFMRKYNDYLEQVNAMRTNRTKPFVMPVSACIEHATKSRVADWELRKPVSLVTEAEQIAWIRLGYDVQSFVTQKLKDRIRAAIVFDLTIADVDSRISKMIEYMMKVIEKNNEEWVLKAEAKMMEVLGETHNKDLKKNVYDFVLWLREYATSYQRFVSLRPKDINSTKTP